MKSILNKPKIHCQYYTSVCCLSSVKNVIANVLIHVIDLLLLEHSNLSEYIHFFSRLSPMIDGDQLGTVQQDGFMSMDANRKFG
jgi:hypothetical protein